MFVPACYVVYYFHSAHPRCLCVFTCLVAMCSCIDMQEEQQKETQEVEISVKDLEKKEAAEEHDAKKTEHYSRLGASFSKTNTLKQRTSGGRGAVAGGRGRISMKKSQPPTEDTA